MRAQLDGKFRLRSTPWAFPRVPRRQPSGLMLVTATISVPAGAPARTSRCTIALPAGSLPWIQPTTSMRWAAAGSPITTGRIACPWTLWPIGQGCQDQAQGVAPTVHTFARPKECPAPRRLHSMKMRGFAALAVLALAAGCGGSGGSGTTTSSSGSAKAFVVLVTDVNQLNDHGFNQLAYQGLKQAQRELGIRGQVYQSSVVAGVHPESSQAARKKADLVISVGFDQAAAIAKVAKQFPDTHFAIIDVSTTPTSPARPKNVQGLIFKEQEVGYLAGYLAGLVEKQSGKQNTIGSVGGQKQPPVDRYIAGYQAGALKADPNDQAAELVLERVGRSGEVQAARAQPDLRRVQTSSSRLRAAAGSACSTQRRSRASGGSASTPTSRISARRC